MNEQALGSDVDVAQLAVGLPTGKRRGKLRRVEVLIAEIEAHLGRNADPLQTLLEIAAGYDALAERELKRRGIDPNSEQAKLWIVPLDVRVDAAKMAARYARPMPLAVTDAEGNSLSRMLPIDQMMRDPNAVRAIEDLQIAMASQTITQIKTETRSTLFLKQGKEDGGTFDECGDPDNFGQDFRQLQDR
jgi:hypothetical protein